jgi:hypothetical protein
MTIRFGSGHRESSPRTVISMESSSHSEGLTGGKRGSSKAASWAMRHTLRTSGDSPTMVPMQPLSLPFSLRVTKQPRFFLSVGLYRESSGSGGNSPLRRRDTAFRAMLPRVFFSSLVRLKSTDMLTSFHTYLTRRNGIGKQGNVNAARSPLRERAGRFQPGTASCPFSMFPAPGERETAYF